MTQRIVRCAFFSLFAALWGCSASDESATTEAELGTVGNPFSTAPGEPNHEEITATGLGFLRPDIVAGLQVADVATDVEFVLVNANHFDDCNFTGGAVALAAY